MSSRQEDMIVDEAEFPINSNSRNDFHRSNSDLRNEAQQLLSVLSQSAGTTSSLSGGKKSSLVFSGLLSPVSSESLTISGLLPLIQITDNLGFFPNEPVAAAESLIA